ncbi:MAG: PepSY domain-containing protein [Gemmatimonadaceae bacterium]|nr:PepSY domain-containing protein [Gemmatimonadaceae bacterium]
MTLSKLHWAGIFLLAPAIAGAQSKNKAARIAEPVARATALKEVPGGLIQSGELEREKGTLVYSYDIKVPHQAGIEEVLVSAITGKVISHEHETPKMEKAEAKKDRQEKAKAVKKK